MPAGLAWVEPYQEPPAASAASAMSASSVREAARDWVALVTLPSLAGVNGRLSVDPRLERTGVGVAACSGGVTTGDG